jgi:hypothetical protein
LSKNRRGNIESVDSPDPFPRDGLTKQYEPFIRDYAGWVCKKWPTAVYDEVLNDLVRLSVEAEPHHKPELGKFGTVLFWRLKRITRLLRKDQQQVKIPGPSKEEREAARAEEKRRKDEEATAPVVYRGGNGTRITIDRQWTANGSAFCRHRVKIGLQLKSSDEATARNAMEQVSGALNKLLDDRPIVAIRSDIEGVLGEYADIQFYKGRKPPNFHKWPTGVVMVSFDQVVCQDEDGKDLTYADVLADGRSACLNMPGHDRDAQVDRLRQAIEAERPFFSPKELDVLAWKLDPDGGRLSHWAAKNGISKGYASKLDRRIQDKLGNRMKKF